MGSVVVEGQINARVEQVFAVMSDIPNAANMISGITKIEMLTEGAVGVGTRWKETRLMFGKEATEEMGITEFIPNHSYVVESDSCGARYRTEIRFFAAAGGTKVRMDFGAKPQTLFAKVMQPLSWMMRGAILKCLEKDLADVKTICEAQPVSESESSIADEPTDSVEEPSV